MLNTDDKVKETGQEVQPPASGVAGELAEFVELEPEVVVQPPPEEPAIATQEPPLPPRPPTPPPDEEKEDSEPIEE